MVSKTLGLGSPVVCAKLDILSLTVPVVLLTCLMTEGERDGDGDGDAADWASVHWC